MSQNQRIIAIILIFLCSCITFFSGLGLGVGLNELVDTDTLTAEVLEEESASSAELDSAPADDPDAYRPAERPLARGELLFEDDFSREAWQVYRDDDHDKGYEAEQYFILVEAESYTFWSVSRETFDDFVLEVETEQLAGPDDNDYGVILRYQDDDNFYTFKISGDGYYAFGKLVDGETFDIIRWQEHDVVRQGGSTNRLRVEASGENFSFYVNDEFIDAAIDPDFSQGDIGLFAGTYENTGVHIGFDNLKVWAVAE